MAKLRGNQRGFAATIITIVVVAVLSLIAVSFALLMRREQRQALDRQLNTQAFYAAESGINDAVEALNRASNPLTTNITDCSGTSQISPGGASMLDSTTGIGYTCVLVNQSPGTLEYSGLNTNESKIVKLQSAGQPLSKVKISWQDSDYNPSATAPALTHSEFAPNNTNFFLPQSQYLKDNPDLFPNNGGTVLRTTIMPAPDSTSRADLINRAQTLFLYPNIDTGDGNVGSASYSPSATSDANGGFANGRCNTDNNSGDTPRHCNVLIESLSGANIYYLRLKPIYNGADVTITGYDINGQPVGLIGEQAVIDSTGKANDVLKRIQVRVPLNYSFKYPEFAVDSLDTICKRFAVYPSSNANQGADVLGLPSYVDYSGDRTNPAECALR